MKSYILNGKKLSTLDGVIPVYNRTFMFGEGVFTSLRTFGGKLLFLEDHITRLTSGTRYYFGDQSVELIEKKLLDSLKELNTLGQNSDVKARLNILPLSKAGRGNEWPTDFHVVMEVEDLGADYNFINNGFDPFTDEFLRVKIVEASLDGELPLKLSKTNNYQESLRQLRIAGNDNWHDVIFVQDGEITEAVTSNAFFLRGNELLTPPLKETILAGTTRRNLLRCLDESSEFQVSERPLKKEVLKDCEEAFLASAIRGLVPIKQLGENKKKVDKFFKLKEVFDRYRNDRLEAIK